MFRRLPDGRSETLPFTIDGRPASGRPGDTVAAALLASGHLACRTTPVSGAPRAPYCMMGVCFECLVRIDGAGNRQGCLVLLTAGMRVETQRGARAVSAERGSERDLDPSPAGEGGLARQREPGGVAPYEEPHPGSASPTRPSPAGEGSAAELGPTR